MKVIEAQLNPYLPRTCGDEPLGLNTAIYGGLSAPHLRG